MIMPRLFSVFFINLYSNILLVLTEITFFFFSYLLMNIITLKINLFIYFLNVIILIYNLLVILLIRDINYLLSSIILLYI